MNSIGLVLLLILLVSPSDFHQLAFLVGSAQGGEESWTENEPPISISELQVHGQLVITPIANANVVFNY